MDLKVENEKSLFGKGDAKEMVRDAHWRENVRDIADDLAQREAKERSGLPAKEKVTINQRDGYNMKSTEITQDKKPESAKGKTVMKDPVANEQKTQLFQHEWDTGEHSTMTELIKNAVVTPFEKDTKNVIAGLGDKLGKESTVQVNQKESGMEM